MRARVGDKKIFAEFMGVDDNRSAHGVREIKTLTLKPHVRIVSTWSKISTISVFMIYHPHHLH